jgi:hypothetical protein
MSYKVRKVQALPGTPEANTVYYVKGSSESAMQVFVTNNTGTIVATPIGVRASSTSSAPTHIPVFTADPSSTTRSLVTRTPSQFRIDIGASPRVFNGSYSSAGGYISHQGTGGTAFFDMYNLPYAYYTDSYSLYKINKWDIRGSITFDSCHPIFTFRTAADQSNSVNFSTVNAGSYRYEIEVITVIVSNVTLKVSFTVKLFSSTNVWQRASSYDRTVSNMATTLLEAMVQCEFSASNGNNFVNVLSLIVVESPAGISDDYLN